MALVAGAVAADVVLSVISISSYFDKTRNVDSSWCYSPNEARSDRRIFVAKSGEHAKMLAIYALDITFKE